MRGASSASSPYMARRKAARRALKLSLSELVRRGPVGARRLVAALALCVLGWAEKSSFIMSPKAVAVAASKACCLAVARWAAA